VRSEHTEERKKKRGLRGRSRMSSSLEEKTRTLGIWAARERLEAGKSGCWTRGLEVIKTIAARHFGRKDKKNKKGEAIV